MKVIQVPMDERLPEAVNAGAKSRRSTPAALIREACERYLHLADEEGLERKYLEGYRRKPESPLVGKLGERMARDVWQEKTWDEAWSNMVGSARRPRRPVLLLARNAAYAVRTSVTVAPLTTTIRDIPVEVRLGPKQGLPRECVVNLDEIQTIRQERLIRLLTTLSSEVVVQVDQALKFALGLN